MDISRVISTLEGIGFSSNEAKVYMTMLKNGPGMAGRISKNSQINRTTTYDILESLLKKGMIKYSIVSNKKRFECVNPETIIKFVNDMKEDAEEILPFLKGIYEGPKEKHNITLFYGYRGIRSAFEMILREAKEVCVMDSENQLMRKMPEFAKHVINKLDEKKIRVLYLLRKGQKEGNASKYTETRYIDKKTASDAVFNIYNDKIVIFVWTSPPEAVVIQNKAAADSMRDYFYMIWRISERK